MKDDVDNMETLGENTTCELNIPPVQRIYFTTFISQFKYFMASK